MGGSSAVAGAIGSLNTSTADNIAYAGQQNQLGQQSLRAQADANKAAELMQIGQIIQSSAGSVAQIGG